MKQQWVQSVTFPPSSWSQFGVQTRTNNDLEGWHRSLNAAVGPRPHLYAFLQRISKEADKARDLISVEDYMRRRTQKQTRRDQRLTRLQEKYMDRELTAAAYLDAVQHVYSTVV